MSNQEEPPPKASNQTTPRASLPSLMQSVIPSLPWEKNSTPTASSSTQPTTNTPTRSWNPYKLTSAGETYENPTTQGATDNMARNTSLFRSPPSERSISTASSVVSNTDVSDELALEIVDAKREVSNAKHLLTRARIKKVDEEEMTKLLLDLEDAEHRVQDLRMRREREKITARMKKEGKMAELGSERPAQGSPTAPVKQEPVGTTTGLVLHEELSNHPTFRHESTQRRPQETSGECNQRQHALHGSSAPGTESTIPAEPSTLAERGMAQRLRMEDAKSYLPETIPDQGIQLTYDLDGTLRATDPRWPEAGAIIFDYPHQLYSRIRRMFAQGNQAYSPLFSPRNNAVSFAAVPPMAQSSPKNTNNQAPAESEMPAGGEGGPPSDDGNGNNGDGNAGDPNRRWGPPIGSQPNGGMGGGGQGGPPGGGNGGPHGGGGPGGPPGGGGPGGPPGGGGGNGSESGHSDVWRSPWQDPWDERNKARGATPFGEVPPEGTTQTEEVFEYIIPEHEGSDLALRERVFTLTARYVAFKLYSKQPVAGDSRNISKMLTNALTALDSYEGEQSVIKLDTFIKGLARLCVAHGLTGPPRILDPYGRWVVTAEDCLRTITLGSNLKGAAKQWYETAVERVPAGFRIGSEAGVFRPSFMEVLRGLFDRFISNAALYDLSKEFKKIRFEPRGGMRQLFADLNNCAIRMPSPPTQYDFKIAITERMPRLIMRLSHQEGITPETSTVNAIMQKAVMVELGMEATQFYGSSLQDTGPTPKKLQVVANARYQIEDHAKMREAEQGRQQKWNKGFAERQAERRTPPKPANSTPNVSRAPRQIRVSRMDRNGSCWACKGFGHFMNDPKCPKRTSKVQFARILEEHEPDDKTTFRISIGEDETEADEPAQDTQEDPYAARLYKEDIDEDGLGQDAQNAFAYEQTYTLNQGDNSRGGARLATTYEPPYIDEDNAEFPHEEGVLDYGEYWRSIQEIPGEEGYFAASVEPKWSKVHKMGMRPRREFEENRCLAAWVSINGIKCFTLFDTGSTANIISPDIATVADVDIFQLKNPVILQLGTKGSRSRINYGCEAEFAFGSKEEPITGRTYIDVANIDRYDMVIGCAFMRKYGVSVDLKNDTIRIEGKAIPTIPAGEEQQELIRRAAKRVVEQSGNEQMKTIREYDVQTFEDYERFEMADSTILEEGMPMGDRPKELEERETVFMTNLEQNTLPTKPNERQSQ
ncbi:hypothetical protein V5O48_010913 [Marasmius crinis-equi]|uniref:Peptidase A2 domain-containing protein n=1 Tax=Marasmius crinis-equi TaxID=585013 RepID=A0ABR3F740_9AGAR